jgi:hypothetical protein
MKPFGPKRMREIAHHEAGHAVVAFRDNHSVIQEVWISVTPIDGAYGKVVRQNSVADKDLTDSENSEWHTDEMIICCAGPEAERRYNPKRTEMEMSDRLELDRLVNAAIGLNQQGKEKQKRWAKINAKALVDREWSAIEKVATSLFERGRLTGEEVAHLIAALPDEQADGDE